MNIDFEEVEVLTAEIKATLIYMGVFREVVKEELKPPAPAPAPASNI